MTSPQSKVDLYFSMTGVLTKGKIWTQTRAWGKCWVMHPRVSAKDSQKTTRNWERYMDIMSEYERMGDFMINISQNLEKAFINE